MFAHWKEELRAGDYEQEGNGRADSCRTLSAIIAETGSGSPTFIFKIFVMNAQFLILTFFFFFLDIVY